MVKKVRNFIDKEEMKSLARYTPKEIAALLDQVGGIDKFNTGEIEKSIVNMYGHLQGHIQRGVNDLENLTNSLLRQKTDVGAFIRGENAYSIVKCSFKDNTYKPKTVTDVKLSVNILDSELISPDLPLPGHGRVPHQGPDLQEHHRPDRQGDREAQGPGSSTPARRS